VSRGTAPLIHNFGTRWRSLVDFKPQLLHLSKTTPAPTERKVGWAPESVWMFWRSEKSLPLPELKSWTIQPIACHYTDYTTPAPIDVPQANK
jgi:hypothetical protein